MYTIIKTLNLIEFVSFLLLITILFFFVSGCINYVGPYKFIHILDTKQYLANYHNYLIKNIKNS